MYIQAQSVFTTVESTSNLPYLDNATFFKLDSDFIEATYKQKSKSLKLSLPINAHAVVDIELQERQILSSDFQVYTKHGHQSMSVFDYTKPNFYKGLIVGHPKSEVSLTFYDDKIAGIIRYKDRVFVFGKYRNSDHHIIYDDNNLVLNETFICESLGSPNKTPEQGIEKNATSCSSAVNVYFECDYDMYQNFNSNVSDVTDYVNDIFNEVYTLYDNEDIPVQISQVVVWTSSDGYANNSSGIYDFQNALNASGFNGDVAMLLTNDAGNNGGVAYVDQLCGSSPYSYSDLYNSYNPYPTYSWDVQVVTHELGHNFGSSHTHECVWGPNGNEQIDDCGNVATGSGGSCYDANNPIIPSSGGTIMSYCHAQSVGINFSLGFGQQPGDLIRQKHSSCFCDNSSCSTATVLTSNGTYFAEPNNGNGASQANATHADWFEFTPGSNGLLDVNSCGEGVDTRVWLWTGSCTSLTYVSYSDDDCDMGNGNNYASEITGFNLNAGTTYFIEWDNRWSSNNFDWQFTFTSTGSSIDVTCPNNFVGTNTCSASDYSSAITGSATSSDNAATITFSDQMSSDACTIQIDRTWTATDVNGNSASCLQTIDLNDTTAPSISSCPNSQTLNSDTNCMASAYWSLPSFQDDCDNNLSVSSNFNSGDTFNLGETSVVYTAMDNCNNISQCSFTITVIDQCSVLEPCHDMSLNITGLIDSSSYRAKMDIITDGILMQGDSTLFTAGQEMLFQSGFEVKVGATFEARVEDCENN